MQARSTLVPWLARLAPRCCSGQSPLAVLGGGVKTWHGSQDTKFGRVKWHFGRKLRDLSSPDDPVPLEVLVRSVSPSWHKRLQASDDLTVQRAFIRCSLDKLVRRMCSSN